MQTLLTPSIIARSFMRFIARSVRTEYCPGEAEKFEKVLMQSYCTVRVPLEALRLDIDVFTERFLIPAVAPFIGTLISRGAECSYDLDMPQGISCARHRYDGLSLRVQQIPLFSDPVLGDDVYVPQADWAKYEPCGYEIRFDVLHSRKVAALIAA